MHFVGIVSFAALLPLVAVAGGCQELPMNDVPIADVGTPAPTSPPEHTMSITSVQSSGDFKMSGRIGLVDRQLTLSVLAIRDPEAPQHPIDPTRAIFSVKAADRTLICNVEPSSRRLPSALDLVLVQDTTASMANAVRTIASSVQALTKSLSATGIDVRYAMYTFGDAFATLRKDDEHFAVGRGDYEPPQFDEIARPYAPLADVDTLRKFLHELDGCPCLGTGGGDAPENALGALAFANAHTQFRDGAARAFLVVSQGPTHRPGDASQIKAPFLPQSPDDLLAQIGGSAVVHVISDGVGEQPYYNLRNLVDRGAGAFFPLGFDTSVALDAPSLQDWFTRGYSGVCGSPDVGTYRIVVTTTIKGTIKGSMEDGHELVGTLTFDVEVR